MALLNRPLPPSELESIMKAPVDLLVGRSILPDLEDRCPLTVHYNGQHGPPSFTPRDTFRWSNKLSPSCCEWIVPGTGFHFR